MTKSNTPRMLPPKYYKPEFGDTLVALKDLRPEHVGRVFEARNQTDGAGILGRLSDVTWHMLLGTIAIRFEGETLGLFDIPEARLLLKAETFDLDAFRESLEGSEATA